MKPITKLYLKIFLFSGITYGLIMTATNLAIGETYGFWEFLVFSSITGVLMSLALVSLHTYKLKKDGVQKLTKENIDVYQTRSLKSELSKTEIFQKLKTDPIIGRMNMTEIENGILLNTGWTWQSWGEEIKILLKSSKENNFEYLLSSSPKLKTTLVDYGKNLKNINQIEYTIKNIA